MIVGSNHQHSTGETVLSHKIYLHRCNMNNQIYYTVYKTTNLINGKIYIGCHQTEDPHDSYLGSGRVLREAIDKHGIENFSKEVLYVFDNADDMYAKEAELVDKDFIQNRSNYNLAEGGVGANSECMKEWWKDEEFRDKMIPILKEAQQKPEVKEKISKASSERWEDEEFREMMSEIRREIWKDPKYRKKMSESTKRTWNDPKYRERMHSIHKEICNTPEYKKRKSEEMKRYFEDPENRKRVSNQFKDVPKSEEHKEKIRKASLGKIWIYSPELDKMSKIPKDDPIPEGWVKGRRPTQ